jgi:hypothetical protein
LVIDKSYPINAHRVRYIFELMRSAILECSVELATQLSVHIFRNTYTARLGDAFQTRCNVHPFTEDVVTFDDDISDMDADPKLDAPTLRHSGVAFCHPPLDVHRAASRFDDARKLDQDAIARGLDDPASMLGYFGIDKISSVGFKLRKRAFLVGSHKPAVSCDVCCQDSG